MPTVLLLAAVLAAEGVSFVLIGSGALALRGVSISVGDVDAVVEPGTANLDRLVTTLGWLALEPPVIPTVRCLERRDVLSFLTSYGRLDCMLRRGRLEWPALSDRAEPINVAGVGVDVASLQDAWRLRRRFKGDPG